MSSQAGSATSRPPQTVSLTRASVSVIFLCALGLVLLLLVPYGWVPGSLLVIFAGVIVVVLVLDRDRLSFKGGPLEGVYEARSTTKVATEVIPDIESPEDAGDHSTRVLGARDRSDLETLTAPQELAEPPTLRPLTAAPQPHLAHSVDAVSA